MGVYTFESETKTSVAPAKLFKALVLDVDNLLLKALPDAFKGCEIIEGNGGPGTIKQLTFSHSGVTKCVKHKIEAIDKENLSYKYSVIEGDMFNEKVEKIDYETKIEESGDGGSTFKNKSTYHTKGDHELKEEEVKEGTQKGGKIFKIIEAYLLANPDY